MKKTVYGRTAYEGFAKAIGAKLGLQVKVDDGAKACIDVNGVVSLPGMQTYQTADEFAVTCGVLVHELAHQFYGSNRLIDPNRSRLEHDCLNAVLDVADETWIDKWFQQAGNHRPGQLLHGANCHAWTTNGQTLTDWSNSRTHAWKVLCLGILAARCPTRNLRQWLRHCAIQARNLGVDALACWKLIKRARLSRENPRPNRKRFRKLIRLAQQLADLLKPFSPPESEPPVESPESLVVALERGQSGVPAHCHEATSIDGATLTSGPPKATSDNTLRIDFDPLAFTSLYPAVQRIAQRIALDGDAVSLMDGLNNGPSLGQTYRLMTDGQALARWSISDRADGVSVAVILDCSDSMASHLPECAGIARAFALGMRDCGAVHSLAFGCSVKEVDDFDRVRGMGSTNTHLALEQARAWLTGRSGAKWIVLITDGERNDRQATDRACAAVQASGIRVISVGLACKFVMPGALCTWASDPTRLAIELDVATRCIEGA